MGDRMKDQMAKMLAKWLFKDFGLLIDEPTEDEISKELETHGEE